MGIDGFTCNSIYDMPNVPQEIEGHYIYNYYRSRMLNLNQSQFEYGLPDTCDESYLEYVFCTRGTAALLNEEVLGWLSLGYTYDGVLDFYRYPTDIRGVGYTGDTDIILRKNSPMFIPKNGEFAVGFDNPCRYNPMWIIDTFAYLLYEIHMVYRNNLNQQNTPYIITAPKNYRFSVKQLFNKLFGKSMVIELDERQKNIKDIFQVLNLGIDFKGLDLLQALNTVWDMALAALGLMSGSEKRERLSTKEVMLNQWENAMQLNSRLREREKMLERAKKKGLPKDCYVRIAKLPVEDLILDEPAPEEAPKTGV